MGIVTLTADWHFDEYARLSGRTEDGITQRLRQILDAWKWLVDTSKEVGSEAIILAGDTWNPRTSVDIAVLDAVCRVMAETSESIPLYFLLGNHDAYMKSGLRNSLQAFRGHSVVVDTEPATFEIAGATFGFVPWVDDPEIMERWISEITDTDPSVLITHTLVQGAIAGGNGIPLSALKSEVFDQVFLGDIHDPVQLRDNVRYLGAPLQFDYGDVEKPRGFGVYDTLTQKFEYVENVTSPRFYVVNDADNVPEFGDGDYVRIVNLDSKSAKKIGKRALAKGANVEMLSLDEELNDAPRLDIQTTDPHETVLRQYCEFMEVEDVDAMVEVGITILDEVKQGI